jgi:hypothetical protein
MAKRAIIIGGAESVWRDLETLKDIEADSNIIAINDAGCEYDQKLTWWVTLHPEKMYSWMQRRANNGFNMQFRSVGFGNYRKVHKLTHEMSDDWGGSSGLFACKIALEKGYDEIILCGVPMNGDANLFRGQAWQDFKSYRGAWLRHLHQLWGKVTSCGGWTQEQLGSPEKPIIKKRAIVLGGAACVWEDFAKVKHLLPDSAVFATNNAGWAYRDKLNYWVTLHPESYPAWQEKRQASGYNMDYVSIGFAESHKAIRYTDEIMNQPSDWRGSSSLFAIKAAFERGFNEVILCGCPLVEMPNKFDGNPWKDFNTYRDAWTKNIDELKGRVYSMSGWTAGLLNKYIVRFCAILRLSKF